MQHNFTNMTRSEGVQQQRSVSVFVQSHFLNLKQSRAAISANRNSECARLNHFCIWRFLLRDPQQSTLPGRQSCVVERYGSLSREVVRWTISRQALSRMLLLSQTWTILQCAFVVTTAFGREKQLLFQRVPWRGFRAIHEQQKSAWRYRQRWYRSYSKIILGSFYIDLYITMFLNFMEACKGVNNCMLTSLPYCIPYY